MNTKMELIKTVLQDLEYGVGVVETAVRNKIDRSTVRAWRTKYGSVAQLVEAQDLSSCKCGFEFLQTHQNDKNVCKSYAYMLGMYLGDGYINKVSRTYRLRIFTHSDHKNLINDIKYHLSVILPCNAVSEHKHTKANCVTTSVYNSGLPLLFPQHGAKHKHERDITLVDWQRDILDRYPESFLSGLIDSDGCSYIQTNIGKRYYNFKNASMDILGLFYEYCVKIGITPVRSSDRVYSIYRQRDRELLETFYNYKTNLIRVAEVGRRISSRY